MGAKIQNVFHSIIIIVTLKTFIFIIIRFTLQNVLPLCFISKITNINTNNMKKIIVLVIAIFAISITNAQWQQTSFNNCGVKTITVKDNNIFIGSCKVYKSPDNGSNWVLSNTGIANDSCWVDIGVNSFVVSGNKIFAGTDIGGIFLSTDNGNSWNVVNANLPYNLNYGLLYTQVLNFAIKDTNIFAGTWGGIYLSTNNGNSWNLLTGLVDVNSSLLTIDALAIKDNTIFAYGYNGSGPGSLYKSLDNGISWTLTGYTNNVDINSIAFIDSTILIGTISHGVLLSTDNGVSWTTTTGLPVGTCIYSLIVNGNNIFAGTGQGFGAVYLSSDKGASWTSMNGGLPDLESILDFVINDGYIFASSAYSGVWRRPLSDFMPDTITTFANPTVGGTISGGGICTFNQSCTVKATANPGYVFTNWTETDTVASTDTSYSFNVIVNRTLVANFASIQGIDSYSFNNSVYIYPNPAKENLTIETNNINTEQRLEIVNLIGQTVYTNIINKKATINTSAFANGVYILKLSSDKETVVRKFVKED